MTGFVGEEDAGRIIVVIRKSNGDSVSFNMRAGDFRDWAECLSAAPQDTPIVAKSECYWSNAFTAAPDRMEQERRIREIEDSAP